MTHEHVEVTQVDREAAANWCWHYNVASGRPPKTLVETFARHRLASAPPPGFVLVPEEPTEAMLDAVWRQIEGASAASRMAHELMSPRDAHKHKAKMRYKAMLAARPEPKL